jgi:hypothetical protein
MTITTTQTLNQKAAKKGGKERAPIIPKENAPFTLGQIKGAIPPHLFKHSMLVRTTFAFALIINYSPLLLLQYCYDLIIEFLLFAASLLRLTFQLRMHFI